MKPRIDVENNNVYVNTIEVARVDTLGDELRVIVHPHVGSSTRLPVDEAWAYAVGILLACSEAREIQASTPRPLKAAPNICALCGGRPRIKTSTSSYNLTGDSNLLVRTASRYHLICGNASHRRGSSCKGTISPASDDIDEAITNWNMRQNELFTAQAQALEGQS